MKLFLLLISVSAALYAQEVSNLYGGFYSAQADAAVARVGDATSPMQNPAGLRKIRRKEISSGASSFSLRKESGRSAIEGSNSALHVSYIRAFERFNLGMSIYTIGSSFKSQTSFSDKTNSENLPDVDSQTQLTKTENTYYALAFAPKGSFWGLSAVLLQFDQMVEQSAYTHRFSNTDPAQRKYASNFSTSEFNLIVAGLGLGLQKTYGKVSLGLSLNTPLYLISQNNNATFYGVNIGANGANDAYVQNYHSEMEPKLKYGKVIPERLKAGIAYDLDNWKLELDYQISAAAPPSHMRSGSSVYSAVWQVQANDYQKQEVEQSEDSESSNFKAQTKTSFGAEYLFSRNLKIGLGALYQPTDSKDKTGVDIYQLTGGISRTYKNYKGSVSLAYTQAQDAGNNYETRLNDSQDQRVNMSFEELGLLMSGSYYF